MSKATNDRGRKPSDKAQAKAERRDVTAPRMSYEALVDVGGEAGGFEAESVDVSLDGIRLRTAYMPELGERMVFRFDGFGGEVVAEGEVVWCEAERRGGEFGVRFTSLEPRAARMLYSMCEKPPATQSEEPSQPPPPAGAQPGDRVRLHIKGLGSPMRARVRDVARGEVLVGSTLEFLRVGRDLELESVEEGDSRIAHIEHVGVDIDPETHIPQLVVALSYDRPSDEPQELSDQLATAPFRAGRGPAQARGEQQEVTPEPQVIDNEEVRSARPKRRRPARDEVAARSAREPHSARQPQSIRVDVEEPDDGEDSPITVPTTLSPEAQAVDLDDEAYEASPEAPQAAARVAELAGKLKPGIMAAGAGAKSVFGKVLTAVRNKRQEQQSAKQKGSPKRTTAPPPSGALRSDGKRLFRVQRSAARQEAPAESVPPPPPQSDKKRALFGAVLGVLAVMAIYFASSQLKGGAEADKDPALAATSEAMAAQPAQPAQPGQVPGAAAPIPGAVGQNGLPTANVPLFGATPMSTTEPVPMPPDPNAPEQDGADSEDEAGDSEPAKSNLKLDKEWGVGEVHNPTVLRLRMNGKLKGLSGSETATGFTIVVPGHKSVSSAAGLARKDKRISSVDVVNYPDRAEVTVRFKGDIPPFVAKTKGKRLIIEISSPKKKRRKKRDKKRKRRR